jgi:hypothetical protein
MDVGGGGKDPRRNVKIRSLAESGCVSSEPNEGIMVGVRSSNEPNPRIIMKIVKKNTQGESRELLLKEYFLNAYLIGLLKRVGEESGKIRRRGQPDLEPAPVRVR